MLAALPLAIAGCGMDEETAKRHREIAEWTIAKGGGVYLDDSSSQVKTKAKLPSRDFMIRRLVLNETKTSDKDLEKLSGMTDLAELSLHSTNITDKGLEHLKPLQALEELELSNTRVTDKGLEHLTGLKDLKKIYLNQTAVTKSGIDMLTSSIPDLKVVKVQ